MPVPRSTRPDERILVWGFEPAVYLLAGRSCPTRFFFNQPVVSPFAPAPWRGELMRSLQADPPSLFLVVRRDAIPWATGRDADSAQLLREFPELDAWVAANYRQEVRIEDFTVLRRARTDKRPR